MAYEEHSVVTLPDSKTEIRFAPDYDRDKLVDLTRRLIVDEGLAERMRKNPTEELARVGIHVDDAARERITDEDILVALGHRQAPAEEEFIGPVAIVIVVVVVINTPQPAY